MMKRFVLAITGASGVCYAKRLFDCLQSNAELHVIISERGAELLNLEMGLKISYFSGENVTVYKNSRINTSIASGSFPVSAMIIMPASMGTIGRIASGVSGTLIERVADVALKEKRKLIVVPRETPFSTIHLKNLLTLDQAGAMILPASPGFYQGQNSMDDLIDFIVARIMDQIGMAQSFLPPYKS